MKKLTILTLSLSLLTSSLIAQKTTLSNWQQNNPLYIIENVGQIRNSEGAPNTDIQFNIHNRNMDIKIGSGTIQYNWSDIQFSKNGENNNLKIEKAAGYRMDLKLLNANKNATIIKSAPAPYVQNYYLAHQGLNGVTAKSYNKVTYQNIYPNIDWVLYTSTNESGSENLKYDFVVHPGGNPKDIQLAYEGATNLGLEQDGSIIATTPLGTIKEHTPYSYTYKNTTDAPKKVASKFVLKDNILGFDIGKHDGTLVIDPVLEWSTYYGGDGLDMGHSITSDDSGNVYMVGFSLASLNIATVGSHQYNNAGAEDAFLVKFDKNGNRLWATYYGSNNLEYGFSVSVGIDNHLYISGHTLSTYGMDPSQDSTSNNISNLFLAKFTSNGTFNWGRIFGTITGNEYGGSSHINQYGQIYICGETYLGNDTFANVTAHQNIRAGGTYDGIIARYDTAGNQIWKTYYGGTGDDNISGLTSDKLGNVYMMGSTNSTSNIATVGSHQATIGGGYDNFIVKFDSTGVRQWGTYYGGSGEEIYAVGLQPLASDSRSEIYAVGMTNSPNNIATSGSHQDTLGGSYDGYIAKFNENGVRLWSTYIGGAETEAQGSVTCDPRGNVLYIGSTSSTNNIATPGAHLDTLAGVQNAFFAKFSTLGARLYSSYFGGNYAEWGNGIGSDPEGNILLTGLTGSNSGLASTGAFLTTYNGGIAAFAAKFCATDLQGIVINGPQNICANAPTTYSIGTIPGAVSYNWILPNGWTGTSTTNTITVIPNEINGILSVHVIKCDSSETTSKSITVSPNTPAEITANGSILTSVHQHQSYQWLVNNQIINGATDEYYFAPQVGDYQLVVRNNADCTDTSSIFNLASVSIKDAEYLSKSIRIYPNPTTQNLYINSPVSVNVILYNILGQKIAQYQQVKMIDMTTLADGVYSIQILDLQNNYIKTEKVVKQ